MIKIKNWVKDHLFEITMFFVVSAIATPAFFFKDNNQLDTAVRRRSFNECKKISTQFIKQRCYKEVLHAKVLKCPDFALNGNIEGCKRDMTARMKAVRPKSKFPLKLGLYFVLELILGSYFFYFKEKWSSW